MRTIIIIGSFILSIFICCFFLKKASFDEKGTVGSLVGSICLSCLTFLSFLGDSIAILISGCVTPTIVSGLTFLIITLSSSDFFNKEIY